MVYNEFQSVLVQNPSGLQLIPFQASEADAEDEEEESVSGDHDYSHVSERAQHANDPVGRRHRFILAPPDAGGKRGGFPSGRRCQCRPPYLSSIRSVKYDEAAGSREGNYVISWVVP